MPKATQDSSEREINEINLLMRQQGWYQEWFRQRGLDPNRVKLNEGQRKSLEATAAQNGFSLGGRMKVDEAGNINQKGGWAGLHPGWKAAIIGGTAVAGGAALGAFGGLGGGGSASIGGSASAGAGAGGSAAGSVGAIPTIGSTAIGTGMGYGPASLAGTSALGGAAAGIPTIGSRQIGDGMGTDPPSIGPGSINGLGDLLWDPATQSWIKKAANVAGDAAKGAASSEIPAWLSAVLGGLSGLPALLAAKQGPSEEEKAYAAQATRLLKQQEQRTQFQNPLYETITRMAYGLQPRMGTNGDPYRYNTLDDVKIP